MSKSAGVSRRQLLESPVACASPFSAALDFPRATGEGVLENASFEFRRRTRAGKAVSRRLVNKLADEAIELPAGKFALEFDTGAVMTPERLPVTGVTRIPKGCILPDDRKTPFPQSTCWDRKRPRWRNGSLESLV
jgi:hypothetical protein